MALSVGQDFSARHELKITIILTMGSIDQLPKPTKSSTTQAWDTLSQILPSRDADKDYWWNLTGLQLAFMLDEAGYTLAEQYEALLFHYHWTVCNQLTRSYHP